MPTRVVTVTLMSLGLMFVSKPLSGQKANSQTGIAAYYSHVFEGRKTSNHGTFHSNKMTAASATLPLGSRVRVTNVKNDKTVVLRITDRYADKNRLLDVSKSAARKLGFIHAGTAEVRVEPV